MVIIIDYPIKSAILEIPKNKKMQLPSLGKVKLHIPWLSSFLRCRNHNETPISFPAKISGKPHIIFSKFEDYHAGFTPIIPLQAIQHYYHRGLSWDIMGLYDVEWLTRRDHHGTIMGWKNDEWFSEVESQKKV